MSPKEKTPSQESALLGFAEGCLELERKHGEAVHELARIGRGAIAGFSDSLNGPKVIRVTPESVPILISGGEPYFSAHNFKTFELRTIRGLSPQWRSFNDQQVINFCRRIVRAPKEKRDKLKIESYKGPIPEKK